MLLHFTVGKRNAFCVASPEGEKHRKPVQDSSSLPLMGSFLLLMVVFNYSLECNSLLAIVSPSSEWPNMWVVLEQVLSVMALLLSALQITVITNSTVLSGRVLLFLFCFIFYQGIPLIIKQRKTNMYFECLTFKAQWSVDYFIIKLDGTKHDVYYKVTLSSVLKEYNMPSHSRRSIHHSITNSQESSSQEN